MLPCVAAQLTMLAASVMAASSPFSFTHSKCSHLVREIASEDMVTLGPDSWSFIRAVV